MQCARRQYVAGLLGLARSEHEPAYILSDKDTTLWPSKTGRIEYICFVKVEISYTYQSDFVLNDESAYSLWLERCARVYDAKSLHLDFAYMTDNELLKLNLKYLDHNTFTDIITFDDSLGLDISANIAISVERVKANAQKFAQSFEDELLRVMSHGLLHCLGFDDKTDKKKSAMRLVENQCIQLFHVEHNINRDV